MNYSEKYLRLLNKKIGREINPLFYQEGTILHYPLVWNAQNNEFYRWPTILKLIKLSPDTIKTKIIINAIEYSLFLNCIFIEISDADQDLLKNYDEDYKKYLSEPYRHPDKTIEESKNIFYVKNIINYFIDTHTKIKNILEINDRQDKDVADKIKAHLELCVKYYTVWRKNINIFYGRPEDELLKTNATTSSVQKVDCLFNKLLNSDNKNKINQEYKKITETAVTTYLKIRCEGSNYNQRFNVFLEPITDNKLPQSMYLTGPNPNNNFGVQYYKGKSEQNKGELTNTTDLNLIPDDIGNLKFVKKYDYGLLYGPFTKIFTPRESNKQIAEKCTEILEKFENNESVFILGYGASGAGKTTALIYNKAADKPEDKDGILLQVLKSEEFKKYTSISVSVHELYSDQPDAKRKVRPYDDIIFKKNDKDVFVISDDVAANNVGKNGFYTEKVRTQMSQVEIDKIYAEIDLDATTNNASKALKKQNLNDIKWVPTQYQWIIENDNDGKGPYFTSGNTKVKNDESEETKKPEEKNFSNIAKIYDPRMLCRDIKDDTGFSKPDDKQECPAPDRLTKPIKIRELGEFILALIDRIRMINPTTNNKQSSRSHGLIYIKVNQYNKASNNFINDKFKYLIVGDLAGVENKFTCEDIDTQVHFLNLKVIDRITGKEIGDVPHYTVNSKLKFIEFPNNPEIAQILNYLTYNPKTKSYSDQYIQRTKWLQRATGQFLLFEYDINVKEIKNDFKDNTVEIEKLRNNLKFSPIVYDDVDNKALIEKIQADRDLYNLNYLISTRFNLQEYTYNLNEILQLCKIGNNLEGTKIDYIDAPTMRKAINDYGGSSDPALKASIQKNKERINTLIETVRNINLEDFNTAEIQKKIQTYDANLLRNPDTVTGRAVKSIISQIPSTGTRSEDQKNELFGLIPGGLEYFTNFYKEKAKASGFPANVFETDFYKLLFNREYTELTDLEKSQGKLPLGIIPIIDANTNILRESGVKALCSDRMNEGTFINNALIGMSENMSNIIQGLNATKDKGLLKNIPLVKEPCFKFFCDQDHQNCFDQLKKVNKFSSVDSSIVDDIKSVIKNNLPAGLSSTDEDKQMNEVINNLGIVVFAVLNINTTANDPVKIPYIELGKLKELREDYLTYKFYGLESDATMIKKIKDTTKKLFVGETGNIDGPTDKSILKVLKTFKPNIGDSLYNTPVSIYNKIMSDNGRLFNNLIELIKSLDIINSLSVIGTMNFLNEFKNTNTTDITCNLIKNEDDTKPDLDSENILVYKNVMTDQELSIVIQQQQKGIVLEPDMIDLISHTIEPAKVPKVVIGGKSKKMNEILGGYLNQLGSNQKQHLLNEYRKLKKIYKNMK